MKSAAEPSEEARGYSGPFLRVRQGCGKQPETGVSDLVQRQPKTSAVSPRYVISEYMISEGYTGSVKRLHTSALR